MLDQGGKGGPALQGRQLAEDLGQVRRVLLPQDVQQVGGRADALQHALTRREAKFLRAGTAAPFFLRDGKRPHRAGELFRQPVLAATLGRLAAHGVADFYQGEIAAAIEADMERHDGFLRRDDLAQVPMPIERQLLTGRFFGHRIFTMPPPGAGNALVEMMNIHQYLPEARRRIDTRDGAVLLAETIRRAFLDRADRPFDPNFYSQVTEKRMLRDDYARELAAAIAKRYLGRGETTHLSAMDAARNAVALTQSIENVYGSCAATAGLGFLYNNYMSAFEHKDISHPYHMRPNAVPWASVAPTDHRVPGAQAVAGHRLARQRAHRAVDSAGPDPDAAGRPPARRGDRAAALLLALGSRVARGLPHAGRPAAGPREARLHGRPARAVLVLHGLRAARGARPAGARGRRRSAAGRRRGQAPGPAGQDRRRPVSPPLPILASVPHAGLRVPAEVAPHCRLTPQQIARDGDEHAAAIYDIAAEVRHVRLAVDCHTMLAVAPPIGPGPGLERPHVCLGNADGTCPAEWMTCLAESLRGQFGPRVTVNEPFRGGYITRSHASEMPWVQLELSRAPFAGDDEKRRRVVRALRAAVDRIEALPPRP